MNEVTQIKPPAKEAGGTLNAMLGNPNAPSARYLAVVLATYEVDNELFTNNINLMLDNQTGFISKNDLARLHVGAVRQVCDETGINPEGLRDIVIMNITALGWSTDEQFYGEKLPKPVEVI